ncbi:MAG: hypothetical protein WCK05_13465 [Planctomycetota bacterium]
MFNKKLHIDVGADPNFAQFCDAWDRGSFVEAAELIHPRIPEEPEAQAADLFWLRSMAWQRAARSPEIPDLAGARACLIKTVDDRREAARCEPEMFANVLHFELPRRSWALPAYRSLLRDADVPVRQKAHICGAIAELGTDWIESARDEISEAGLAFLAVLRADGDIGGHQRHPLLWAMRFGAWETLEVGLGSGPDDDKWVLEQLKGARGRQPEAEPPDPGIPVARLAWATTEITSLAYDPMGTRHDTTTPVFDSNRLRQAMAQPVDELVGQLDQNDVNDPYPLMYSMAAIASMEECPEPAVERLVALALHGRAEVRGLASACLGELASRQPRLLETALNTAESLRDGDRSYRARVTAVRTLGRCAVAEGPDVAALLPRMIAALVQGMNDAHGRVVAAAICEVGDVCVNSGPDLATINKSLARVNNPSEEVKLAHLAALGHAACREGDRQSLDSAVTGLESFVRGGHDCLSDGRLTAIRHLVSLVSRQPDLSLRFARLLLHCVYLDDSADVYRQAHKRLLPILDDIDLPWRGELRDIPI